MSITNDRKPQAFSRRTFMQSALAAGAGAALSNSLFAQTAPSASGGGEDIRCAIVGIGKQGQILLPLALKIPGVRFVAVCDIWSYSQKLAQGICKQARQDVKVYDDYKQMLAEQKDLDAVIVATPDFWHASVTNDCLKAGKHVYCEKEMSNKLEDAASMVRTQRETGKLLQIGHQRRSNPFYQHAYQLMHKDGFCGDIYVVNGQWNQLKPLRPLPAGLVQKYSIPDETLQKWGFKSMNEFYEWRWFNRYAGGPMTDLGSHQVDIFNWFLDAVPSSVTAFGGAERALAEAKAQDVGFTPECFDNTMCVYEWKLKDRTVRGYYQVNLNSSYGGFYEVFEGTRGTMVTAEIKERAAMFKEQTAPTLQWTDDAAKFEDPTGKEAMHFDPLASRKAKGKMTAEELKAVEEALNKPPHQPHLENFFNAVRGKEKLNCPAEEGYATAVTVLKANEAAMTGKRIEFKPEDFKVA